MSKTTQQQVEVWLNKMADNHPLKCSTCGQFIGFNTMFRIDFEPDSHFGPEIVEYTCERCLNQTTNEKEN